MNLTDENTVSGADINQFTQSLFGLLDDLETRAANSDMAKKFATGERGIANSMTVYKLAQCSVELSSPQCETCLQNAVGVLPTCCEGRQDFQRRRLLNWVQRYEILEGIACGILYLHEHSRLKVIHRDLKLSNVLLEYNMDPKISDFGMARVVAIDYDQGKTRRIVGTYFEVITLEVISAKRSARSLDLDDVDDPINHAWGQWRNETPLEILDPDLKEACPHSEVMRCIQIGLLCVYENPNDRPTMANIVSYFGSPSAELPLPRQPTFFMNNGIAGESSSGSRSLYSVNDLSISNSFPR